jgi:aminoglycoside phosphotransferase (APT) family kinase protein
MNVGCVPDESEHSIRAALAAAAPALADAALRLPEPLDASPSEFHAATVVVASRYVLKYAWSATAAVRVSREARLLQALTLVSPELPVPQVVGASDDPAAFVTERVHGYPLRSADVRDLRSDERERVAHALAAFLARLREPSVLSTAFTRVAGLVAPPPQGKTSVLRERLPGLLDARRAAMAVRWCNWVDDTLATEPPHPVLAHGDLHGYNQLWDRQQWLLRLVVDFESAGPADAEYDLRYLPSQEPSLRLFTAVAASYADATGRALDINRVFAWHVLTVLGDALWRTEAGVPLPGGETPATYVDGLEWKLAEAVG